MIARNLMREMKKGDYALFYHSNCKVPGVVGMMEIVQEHSVDGWLLSAFTIRHCSDRDSQNPLSIPNIPITTRNPAAIAPSGRSCMSSFAASSRSRLH